MATYVLVHGAWHGAWCWEKIVPGLEAQGHRVIAVDLPGHGTNPYPTEKVTFKVYTDYLTNFLKDLGEPVILVGHSLAGAVITQVAEYVPELVKKLVYVTASLLPNGKSNLDFCHVDYTPLLTFSDDPAKAAICFGLNEKAKDFFYPCCPEDDAQRAMERVCVQSILIHEPMQTTPERFGRIPKVFIEALQDQAILPEEQRAMTAAVPCEKVFSLDGDHSLFYSKPKELTDILLAQALG